MGKNGEALSVRNVEFVEEREKKWGGVSRMGIFWEEGKEGEEEGKRRRGDKRRNQVIRKSMKKMLWNAIKMRERERERERENSNRNTRNIYF